MKLFYVMRVLKTGGFCRVDCFDTEKEANAYCDYLNQVNKKTLFFVIEKNLVN